MDSKKIDAVKQWPITTSTTDIRSYIGLAGYYRRFVEEFSSITLLLTRLTKKMVKFKWSDHCEKGLCNQINLSTTFHLQMDGQAERTIKTLEDMFRACVIDFKGIWDEQIPLIEFAYNNSYHSSIQIAPYEALYGRRCRYPFCWF